jgi:hypothetical protein
MVKDRKKEKIDPSRVSNPGRWIRSRRTKPLHYECFLEKKNEALYMLYRYTSDQVPADAFGNLWG